MIIGKISPISLGSTIQFPASIVESLLVPLVHLTSLLGFETPFTSISAYQPVPQPLCTPLAIKPGSPPIYLAQGSSRELYPPKTAENKIIEPSDS